MTWREVGEWVTRQQATEERKQAMSALLRLVASVEWDVFYSQTFARPVRLAGAKSLLRHSLAVLRSSLTARVTFVTWEQLSPTGREGWHAHCMMSLLSRSKFRPCGADWKRCEGPSPRWSSLSKRWKQLFGSIHQLDRATSESEGPCSNWCRRHVECTLWCQRKVILEEQLAKRFGWARIEPILRGELGPVAYVMKYVTKTLAPQGGDDILWEWIGGEEDATWQDGTHPPTER